MLLCLPNMMAGHTLMKLIRATTLQQLWRRAPQLRSRPAPMAMLSQRASRRRGQTGMRGASAPALLQPEAARRLRGARAAQAGAPPLGGGGGSAAAGPPPRAGPPCAGDGEPGPGEPALSARNRRLICLQNDEKPARCVQECCCWLVDRRLNLDHLLDRGEKRYIGGGQVHCMS